jgi:putative DNA primase/helicase
MTLMTAVAPGGACPRWHEFLDVVTGGDAELQKFLQDACGYALTGSTREEILLFLHGGGQNGKSVFIKTIAGVLGDYHMAATMEMFVDSPYERHPTDMARLRGARLVTAAETEQGRYWAESKIKMLTGGDRIAARFMRQDFFEYTPQFTLMIFGNHRPSLKSVDDAIRRRIRLIPFTVRIAEDKRDKELADKLKAEWPGILAWMVEGCLRWQRHGLLVPDVVKAATDEYLATEDAISRWLDDCCSRDQTEATLLADLYGSWSGWAERSGEGIGSAKRLSQELTGRGFAKRRTKFGYELIGLKIKVDVALDEESKNPDDLFG